MSFNAIRENVILVKISEFTVTVRVLAISKAIGLTRREHVYGEESKSITYLQGMLVLCARMSVVPIAVLYVDRYTVKPALSSHSKGRPKMLFSRPIIA